MATSKKARLEEAVLFSASLEKTVRSGTWPSSTAINVRPFHVKDCFSRGTGGRSKSFFLTQPLQAHRDHRHTRQIQTKKLRNTTPKAYTSRLGKMDILFYGSDLVFIDL